MSTPSRINSWHGWAPERPDHRDKFYSAIAKAPKKLPSKGAVRRLCSGG